MDLAEDRVATRSGGSVVEGEEAVARGSGEVANVVDDGITDVSVETALRRVE